MSGDEIAWRLAERARTSGDRLRSRLGRHGWRRQALGARLTPLTPRLADAARALRRGDTGIAESCLLQHFRTRDPRFLVHASVRDRLRTRVLDLDPDAADAAVRLAGSLTRGRYDLLGYEGLRVGTGGEIDWHRDPVSGRRAPLHFSADVNYLDPLVGDHKVIWELNRHQEWMQLGRASWLAGDDRFREAFVAQLQGWMASNPPLRGINWASALELALRSLSWLWALELFVPATPQERSEPRWVVDLLLGIERQLRHVERHLSWYFSPNTHLLGEGLALYVCGRALPELAASARWSGVGRRVLLQESTRQVLPDGGHAERSTHYHRYALDFYVLALAVARRTGDWRTAARLQPVAAGLATFMRDICDDSGRYALIGDDDGGELAPVAGRTPGDARPSLWWAACALEDPSLAAGEMPEAVLWLTALNRGLPARLHAPARRTLRRSSAYPAAGYYISRQGRGHLVFDAGPHGYMNAGHAHADALAVTLSLDGRPLLVDGGTATYTMDPAVRDHFRTSQAHNTITLDGRSQSVPAGPFHWQSVVHAAPGRIVFGAGFDYFEGSVAHESGVRHERWILSLDLDGWIVADRISGGPGCHEAAIHWHVGPEWTAADEPGGVRLVHRDGVEARVTPVGAAFDILRAAPDGHVGWVSPVYGRTTPSTMLRGLVARRTPFSVATLFERDQARSRRSARIVEVLAADDRNGGLAILAEGRDGLHVTLFGGNGRDTRTVILDPRRGIAITTDAHVLHARVDAEGRLERACAVDCALMRFEGRHSVTALALDAVSDFDIVHGPAGACRVASSAGPDAVDVRLDADDGPAAYVVPALRPDGSSHVRHRGIR